MINLVRFRLEKKLIKFKFVAQSEDFSSEGPVLSRRRQKLGLVRPLGGPTASDTNLLFASPEGTQKQMQPEARQEHKGVGNEKMDSFCFLLESW